MVTEPNPRRRFEPIAGSAFLKRKAQAMQWTHIKQTNGSGSRQGEQMAEWWLYSRQTRCSLLMPWQCSGIIKFVCKFRRQSQPLCIPNSQQLQTDPSSFACQSRTRDAGGRRGEGYIWTITGWRRRELEQLSSPPWVFMFSSFTVIILKVLLISDNCDSMKL